jgi:DNA-binding CsgD family transcriptional regulator
VLLGRAAECQVLDRLAEAVRMGESRALVIRGEAGVGKTALLDYLQEHASGCRLARVAGLQFEMELAFAALHQLCASMLDRLPVLPEPQRDALGTAFGIRAGPAPDRFLVGLAVLNLLAETADERPLVCLIDDAQWLDRASAQTLAVAARRLVAESVAVVFAIRESDTDVEPLGLPELVIDGLEKNAAHALLHSVTPALLDQRVRDRIVAETRGNPLAILEFSRAVSRAELASGLVLPGGPGLADRIESSFARRVALLPSDTRRLLLVAAAEPVGEQGLVWRAAERLGIGIEAAAPAIAAGLCDSDASLRFRHPLVRSAVYRAASVEDRRTVHRVLAEATDPESGSERIAWHRAQAATQPDEELAAELERSADRAQARGGFAQAQVFLQQATVMTPDPVIRARRAVHAAQVALLAGAFEVALRLLTTARAGPLDELGRAQADLLHAQIAFAVRRSSEAAPLLLAAAKRLELLDVGLARETYLEAFAAAMFADRPSMGVGMRQVAEAARAAPQPSEPPRPADLLLDSLALRFTEGYAAGVSPIRKALGAFRSATAPDARGLPGLWLAGVIAPDLWDHESWDVLTARHVDIARHVGALSQLALALDSRTYVHLFAGELRQAALLVEEAGAITEATGSGLTPYGALGLRAWQGRRAELRALMQTEEMSRHEGVGIGVAQWAVALLENGFGHYQDALVVAEQAAEQREEVASTKWALVELIEAAARSGSDAGADALRALTVMTQASGTDWALGLEARSRALLDQGGNAESLYREAIERLRRTPVRAELARAHLLYGEWLRRERRRLDAREQLRTAHDLLVEMGIEAFAERAARELRATGATARKRRRVEASGDLTPQEAQVAHLAREGLSNREIASRLFLSPRTVEYHLRKVFTKLQIKSRQELALAFPH